MPSKTNEPFVVAIKISEGKRTVAGDVLTPQGFSSARGAQSVIPVLAKARKADPSRFGVFCGGEFVPHPAIQQLAV